MNITTVGIDLPSPVKSAATQEANGSPHAVLVKKALPTGLNKDDAKPLPVASDAPYTPTGWHPAAARCARGLSGQSPLALRNWVLYFSSPP